jgi:hypothetical protein
MYMSDNEEQIVKNVFVDWVVPESVPTQRVTNIVIQKNGPTDFVVSLFEQREPFFTGSREQQLQQFHKVERISAVCIARLVVSPDKLVEFARAFNESLDEFQLPKPSPLKTKGDE